MRLIFRSGWYNLGLEGYELNCRRIRVWLNKFRFSYLSKFTLVWFLMSMQLLLGESIIFDLSGCLLIEFSLSVRLIVGDQVLWFASRWWPWNWRVSCENLIKRRLYTYSISELEFLAIEFISGCCSGISFVRW